MNSDTLIGQYKILRTLGAGGMGTVYLGEHILLGRRAAIKTLLPALSSHREIVERFFNEARAISAISDPGVVQIFDFGYHVDGTAYIVMEFLEGESLAGRLDRLGKLSLVDALRITRQIASSLGAAHARGIIHRDLKPGNVFVTRDSEAQGGERTKILDFGIAKLVSSPADAVTTQTGTMLGTPVYMSPEQCRGAGKVDHRSDIYSAGCALYHMLTGTPPYDYESVGDFIAAHLKEDPRPPSDLSPELPPEVDALVLRCLAKRPEDRFQTMAELQGEVEAVLAQLSDSGVDINAPMNATPLGEGFQSAYDVNKARGPDAIPTVNQTPTPRRSGAKPSHSWFVDSMSSGAVPSPEEDDHEWLTPERGLSLAQRVALVLALFAGLVGGVIVTGYVLDDDGNVTVASPAVTSPVDPVAPATATTQEQLPAEPVANAENDEDLEDAQTEHTIDLPDDAPAAPVVQRKPERPHPARTQQRPRPRRHVVVPQEPVETQPEDDLYDTR